MQVIAGKAKGCVLKSPKGARTRPTTALVRGAIFSILQKLLPCPSRVLDLYAGTGALGIEALSRGAEWADFVERDPRCCALIRENLERAGLAAQARVYCLPVAQALPLLPGQYDLILLDPPYADLSLPSLLTTLSSSKLADGNSILVVQHSRHVPLSAAYGRLRRLKQRRYGETCLSIYQQEGEVDHRTLPRQL